MLMTDIVIGHFIVRPFLLYFGGYGNYLLCCHDENYYFLDLFPQAPEFACMHDNAHFTPKISSSGVACRRWGPRCPG